MSGAALTEGIKTIVIDGVKVPVFNAAKTVADCFKYRNKIGLDVPTRDADLLGFGPDDTDTAVSAFRGICRIEVEDGIAFDPNSVRGSVIRPWSCARPSSTRWCTQTLR